MKYVKYVDDVTDRGIIICFLQDYTNLVDTGRHVSSKNFSLIPRGFYKTNYNNSYIYEAWSEYLISPIKTCHLLVYPLWLLRLTRKQNIQLT